MNTMDSGELREELEQQSKTAKEFYETDIYEYEELRTNFSVELQIMQEKISAYGNDNTNDIFLHLGAGKGRFVKELHTIFHPKKTIAIDSSNFAFPFLEKLAAETRGEIEVKHESFFDFDFSSLASTNGRLFIFMNWSVLAEVGSKKILIYLLNTFFSLKKSIVIMGDMSEQFEYINEQKKFTFYTKTLELGTMLAPGEHNKNIRHLNYVPAKEYLQQIVEVAGYFFRPYVLYQTQFHKKRYFFEFLNFNYLE